MKSAAGRRSASGSSADSSRASGTSASVRSAWMAARPRTGSSQSSMPAGASARSVASASSGSPGPVGVDADRHVRAGERADRGEPAGVVADRHLDLDGAVALSPGGGGLVGGARAVAGGDRPVDRDRRRPARHRAAATPAHWCGVPPGPTAPGRSRPAPAGEPSPRRNGPARRRSARRRGSSPAPARHASSAGADLAERDPVVGLKRRRLAVAGQAVGGLELDEQELAVGDRSVTGGERRLAAAPSSV